MQCGDYRDVVAAHVDGQLAPEEEAQAAAHVASCARCAALLANERQFVRDFHARRLIRATPADVRQQVLAALAAPEQRLGWRARLQHWWARPQYRAALAGAVVLLVIALALTRSAGPPEQDVLPEILAHYREAEAMRLEVKTDKPEELEHYFEEKGITPPTLTVMDLRPLGFKLMGGSVTHLGTAKSVMMVYQGERGWILCHRFRAADLRLPPGEVVGGDTYYTVDGLTVCTYRDGDAICIMAAAMPRADFMKLLAGYV